MILPWNLVSSHFRIYWVVWAVAPSCWNKNRFSVLEPLILDPTISWSIFRYTSWFIVVFMSNQCRIMQPLIMTAQHIIFGPPIFLHCTSMFWLLGRAFNRQSFSSEHRTFSTKESLWVWSQPQNSFLAILCSGVNSWTSLSYTDVTLDLSWGLCK